MSKIRIKTVVGLCLGMLTFAVAAFCVDPFFLVERPEKGGIIEDWEQICLWQDQEGIFLSISPQGCYSSSCTRIQQQTGTAIIDLQNREIHLEARFMLLSTSRFPLPCTKDCYGGGAAQFKLAHLIPNDYAIWYLNHRLGDVKVFSGKPTPRQCFVNSPE